MIFLSNLAFSQSIEKIDSVAMLMCDYLKKIEIKNDTIILNTLYEKQLYPYLENFEEVKAGKIGQQVYFRLQKNCLEFMNLLNRLDPPKETTTITTTKPKPTISRKELKEFKKTKEFYYLEVSGDTTNVLIENRFWVDNFSDNTFSRLNYIWLNDTEFELEYLESNNLSRSYFSVKGDKYLYQVLSKEDNFYYMTLNIPGQKTFEKFKMYYK